MCAAGYLSHRTAYEQVQIAKGMQLEDLSGGMVRCAWAESECLLLGENSGRGAIHFDNIASAILSIYQVNTGLSR